MTYVLSVRQLRLKFDYSHELMGAMDETPLSEFKIKIGSCVAQWRTIVDFDWPFL